MAEKIREIRAIRGKNYELLPSREFAAQLDQQDSLASYREQFVVNDPDLIYLDGNSLGRLPKSVIARMKKAVDEEWGTDLIRGWNKGWWESPARIGDKIGSLLGAAEGQVIVGDQTSINLFKLATAALTLQPQKKRIITDTFNFPSDLYILQGIVKSVPPWEMRSTEIIRIGAQAIMTSRPISPPSKLPSTKTRRSSRFRMSPSKAAICTTWRTSPNLLIAKARSSCGI